MKRFFKSAKVAIAAAVATAILAITTFGSGKVAAIPYTGDTTQPSPVPAFNVYTGVPSVGDESKFFNGRLSTETNNDARDPITTACENGTKFILRAYVHNGASQANNDNGNGPSVAKGTNIKVTLPTASATNFAPTATISATNAASVTDNVTITCNNGKTFTIRYVAGSAQQYNPTSGVQNLSDNIVTTGAPIGTMSPNGDMWGCWDQRVWVRLEVELVEVPTTVEQAPATCDLLQLTQTTDNRKRYNFAVTSTAHNATVNKVRFVVTNTGNNQTVATNEVTTAQLPYAYTFPADGNYSVRATLVTTFNGQTQEVSSANCVKTASFSTTPPVVIPNTGSGSMLALFAGVTLAGAAAHNVKVRRSVR